MTQRRRAISAFALFDEFSRVKRIKFTLGNFNATSFFTSSMVETFGSGNEMVYGRSGALFRFFDPSIVIVTMSRSIWRWMFNGLFRFWSRVGTTHTTKEAPAMPTMCYGIPKKYIPTK